MMCLFIGGEYDGAYLDVPTPEHCHYYKVASKTEPCVAPSYFSAAPLEPTYLVYTRHIIQDDNSLFYIYTLGTFDIVQTLINHYRK